MREGARTRDAGANGRMATTSSIDLSRLPRPTVIEPLSYDTFLGEMVAAVQLAMPDLVLVEADPVMKTLRIAAGFRMMDRQTFNDDAVSRMLAYAVDADLDHLGALVGVERLVIVPANPGTGAAAVMEDDTTYRDRIANGTEEFSVAGPEGAYRSLARRAHGDVLDATATSPTPGEVVVTVLSRAGEGVASADVLAAVTGLLSADDRRPMTDQVTVQSAEIVEYAISATYKTLVGPDPSVVFANALASGQAYAARMHRLGLDVTLSGLYAALHVEGMQKVTLITPAADIVVDKTQASWCTSVTLTPAGVGE